MGWLSGHSPACTSWFIKLCHLVSHLMVAETWEAQQMLLIPSTPKRRWGSARLSLAPFFHNHWEPGAQQSLTPNHVLFPLSYMDATLGDFQGLLTSETEDRGEWGGGEGGGKKKELRLPFHISLLRWFMRNPPYFITDTVEKKIIYSDPG